MKPKKKKLTVQEKNDRLNSAEDRSAIIEDKSVHKIFQSKMQYGKLEDDIIENFTKERFIEKLINKFDFETLSEDGNIEFINKIIIKRKQSNTEFYKFNIFIKQLNDSGEVNIVDSMKYMLEDYINQLDIKYCLNEDNMFELRKLLGEKHKIKFIQSSLSSIL